MIIRTRHGARRLCGTVLPLALCLSAGRCGGAAMYAALPLAGALSPEPTYHIPGGQRVRVAAPSFGIPIGTATAAGSAGDSLVLRDLRLGAGDAAAGPDSARRAVPIYSLASLEIYLGRRPNPGVGAALGLFIGGVAGAITLGGSSSCSIGSGGTRCTALGAVAGAAAGIGLGAAFGQVVLRTDRWERIPLDHPERIRVGVVARPGASLGVGASIAF